MKKTTYSSWDEFKIATRFPVRGIAKTLSFLAAISLVVTGVMMPLDNLILWAPSVFFTLNLVLETLLYRVFKMKDSRWFSKKVLRNALKITGNQLDKASLVTNKVKLFFFVGVSLLGCTVIATFDFPFVSLGFFLAGNAFFGATFLNVYIYKRFSKMPYVGVVKDYGVSEGERMMKESQKSHYDFMDRMSGMIGGPYFGDPNYKYYDR